MRSRSSKRGAPKAEAHVRLYRHELECPAYRALSPAARALLIELRALFSPKTGDNRVFLSSRQIQKRCKLTQAAAKRASDELSEHGWVTVEQRGSFDCKVRHATVYALENEPPNTGNGSQARKSFMRWPPDSTAKKHGSGIDYRTVAGSTTDESREGQKMAFTVAESTTVTPNSDPFTVAESTTQILLPPVGGFCSGPSAVDPPLDQAHKRRARA